MNICFNCTENSHKSVHYRSKIEYFYQKLTKKAQFAPLAPIGSAQQEQIFFKKMPYLCGFADFAPLAPPAPMIFNKYIYT